MPTPFHLSITVADLGEARAFYGGVLGCEEGRSAPTWVDFDFFGHQLSLHLGPVIEPRCIGQVEALSVPMPHFGVVLPMPQWRALADRLRQQDFAFEIEPQVRFEGEPGEQAMMFFRDNAGNAIEIKGFDNTDGLFSP